MKKITSRDMMESNASFQFHESMNMRHGSNSKRKPSRIHRTRSNLRLMMFQDTAWKIYAVERTTKSMQGSVIMDALFINESTSILNHAQDSLTASFV